MDICIIILKLLPTYINKGMLRKKKDIRTNGFGCTCSNPQIKSKYPQDYSPVYIHIKDFKFPNQT